MCVRAVYLYIMHVTFIILTPKTIDRPIYSSSERRNETEEHI